MRTLLILSVETTPLIEFSFNFCGPRVFNSISDTSSKNNKDLGDKVEERELQPYALWVDDKTNSINGFSSNFWVILTSPTLIVN